MRSDNGPEFIAQVLQEFLNLVGSEASFIEPGAPWENGFAESFNSRFRDEFLNMTLIADLKEARVEASRWKEHYNFDRPHSSLGDRTPVEFAAEFLDATPLGATQHTEQRQKTPRTGNSRTLIAPGSGSGGHANSGRSRFWAC